MTGKRFERVAAAAVVLAFAFTLVVTAWPNAVSVSASGMQMAYADTIFDKTQMMTVEITVPEDDWQGLLDNALAEAYIACDVTINGTTGFQVGIRCKGNSSLRSVGEDQRYSYKLKFDEYVNGQTMLGLDKMVLNNTQSDATWMKEYLTYYTMDMVGVNVPLYALAKVYVNGELWGLYLGLEVLEQSYALRNYGTDHGHLYKVESMDMDGGMRGGGMNFSPPEGFEMPDLAAIGEFISAADMQDLINTEDFSAMQAMWPQFQEAPLHTDGASAADDDTQSAAQSDPEAGGFSGGGDLPGSEGFQDGRTAFIDQASTEGQAPPEQMAESSMDTAAFSPDRNNRGLRRMDGGMAMFSGGNGADLIYIDDNPESYSAIFTKTSLKATQDSDKARVIAALKGIDDLAEDIADYVDVDQMLRYIAGNAAVGNGDSYFGNMMHNYYVYEQNGKITMLPWDYNLAFGGFMGGADDLINLSIDEPFTSGTLEDRPIIARLLENAQYKETYHEYIRQIGDFYANGEAVALIDSLNGMIREWVDLDPTKAYTTEQYDAAVSMLRDYITLRGQSMLNQLDGDTERLNTSGIVLSTMGSQSGGMGGGMRAWAAGGRANNAQAFDGQQQGVNLPDNVATPENMPQSPRPVGEAGFSMPGQSMAPVINMEAAWLIALSGAVLAAATVYVHFFKRRRFSSQRSS